MLRLGRKSLGKQGCRIATLSFQQQGSPWWSWAAYQARWGYGWHSIDSVSITWWGFMTHRMHKLAYRWDMDVRVDFKVANRIVQAYNVVNVGLISLRLKKLFQVFFCNDTFGRCFIHSRSLYKRKNKGKATAVCEGHCIWWFHFTTIYYPESSIHHSFHPLQSRCFYSVAINSLILAMASPGCSPFGQVLLQFMMVWQR